MTTARIIFKDRSLFLKCDTPKLNARQKMLPEDFEAFRRWIGEYQQAVKQHNQAELLLKSGREIHTWLEGKFENGLERLCKELTVPPLWIEFSTPPQPEETELLFLEVPWEILANDAGHLAASHLKFTPIRRFGDPGDPQAPSEYRLSLLFMAAAPRKSTSLDFEAEENAILTAASQGGVDLSVEESGNLELLSNRLAREQHTDVLHISCHGYNQPRPVLLLESPEGDAAAASPDEFAQEIGEHKPRLLFLSACLTSAANANTLLNSYAAELIRQGYPAVIGWAGSVMDGEATDFAAHLYRFLAKGNSLRHALATARYQLLHPKTAQAALQPSQDWHLARLYLGKQGGDKLTSGKRARRLRPADYGHKEFLDSKGGKVPVASRHEFVGRRRAIQDILREFRIFHYAGVLVHGFGR